MKPEVFRFIFDWQMWDIHSLRLIGWYNMAKNDVYRKATLKTLKKLEELK